LPGVISGAELVLVEGASRPNFSRMLLTAWCLEALSKFMSKDQNV
jgi:hypothetical protein